MPFNLHETLTKIGPPQERSKDWQHDKKIVELHSDLFDYVASLDYDYPKDKFARKGIVICGGGKYAHLAWIAISNLRDLGCSLPIELWYKGVIELNSLQVREFEKLGFVTCHNTESISYKPRIVNGWEMKPFSILFSSFEEVLLMDADNIAIRDPSYLFNYLEYQKTGAIFWPDLPTGKDWIPKDSWEAARISESNRKLPPFESGQILVDKSKCWKALWLTMHLNEYSDFWYEYVYGDKDTFKLAWHKLNQEYAMPTKDSKWHSPAIIQHDLSNSAVFYHCCQGKKQLKDARKIGCIPNPQREKLLKFSRDYPKSAGLEGTLKDRTAFEEHCRSRAVGVKLSEDKVITRIYSDVVLFCDDKSKSFTPHLMKDGFWEAWISLYLLRTVKKEWSVLNIGAHVGYFTFLLAPYVRRVVAVEPNRRNYDLMHLSNKENEFDHINIIHGALSNKFVENYYIPNNYNDVCGNVDGVGDHAYEVPAYSLKELINLMDEEPDLIICDAEGAERYLDSIPNRALIEVEYGREYPEEWPLMNGDLLFVDYDSSLKYTNLSNIKNDATRSYMVWIDNTANRNGLPQEAKDFLSKIS